MPIYQTDVSKIQNPSGVYGEMQGKGITDFGHFYKGKFTGKQKFLASRENTQTGKHEEGVFTYNKNGTSSFTSYSPLQKTVSWARKKIHEGNKRALYECIPWPIKAGTNYEGQKEPGRAKKKFWGTIIRYGPMLPPMAKFAIDQEVATGHPSVVGAAGRIAGPFLALGALNFIKGAVKGKGPEYSSENAESMRKLAGRTGNTNA